MYVFCILYAVRARTSLAHNLSSFLNSNYPVFLHRFHPIWSAGGSGLRSVIVIACISTCISKLLMQVLIQRESFLFSTY